MKYSNTTIRELNAQYRSVLKKCALFNAAVLIGALVAMPAVAATEWADRVVVSASDDAAYDDILAKDLDSLDKNGAAIQIEGKATITNSTFENNSTGKNGGAIRVQGPTGASAKDVTEMPSLSISNTKFIANNADGVDGDSGALSIQSGTVNITNSTFDQNTAGLGGAIYAYTGNYSKNNTSEHNFVKVTIKDSVFTNNIGSTTNAGDEAAGAIGNFASAIRNDGDAGMWIDNTRFEGNQAIRTNAGGGAIFAGSESRTNIANSSFTNNSSETVGGAIATRVAVNATGTKNANTGVLDIINTTFTGNKATTNGGAIDNYLHDSDTLSGSVYVANSAFDTNSAENGGAIYNHGDLDKNGLGGNMTIKDSTFTGNTAAKAGGAIYNKGAITFSGTVNFEGNTASNVKNDIYNDGIINIAAGATVNFDGGIDADITTAGSVLNIGDGATLGLRLTSAADYTQIKSYEINYLGTTNLNLTIGAVGTYNVFDSEMDTYAGDILPTIMANPLYDFEAIKDVDETSGLEYFTGSIKVSTKSADKIVEDTGLDQNQANALVALTQSDTELSNQLSLAAQEALQAGNTEVVKQEVDKLNPETAPVTQTIAQNNHTQVLNVLNNRMTGFGRNGGDVKVDYGAWAQTMYNKSKLDGEFKGYTQGLAAGFDALLDDTYTVGLGYAYSASTVKPTGRKMDVWAHNFFLYGQYKPNKFYVNGALNYARSEYKEKTNVLGIAFNSKFDTDTYGAQAVAGYELPYGFTPEAGARYVYVHQEKYNNGLADIKAKNNDVLTGVAGVKYAAPAVGKEFAFQPEVKAFATYDFLSDNGKSVVTVAGASPYMVTGKRLARFGAEFGVGATLEYKDAELTLSYDLGVRRDYTSQTGTLKLKYNF